MIWAAGHISGSQQNKSFFSRHPRLQPPRGPVSFGKQVLAARPITQPPAYGRIPRRWSFPVIPQDQAMNEGQEPDAGRLPCVRVRSSVPYWFHNVT